MDFINSSIEEPIGFFEDYFRKNGITKHLHEFKDWCIKEEIAHPNFVKILLLDDDCIIHRKGYNYSLDDDGNLISGVRNESLLIDSFSDDAEKLLKSEFEKSKILLKESSKIYLSKYNDNTKFLSFQKALLDEIMKDCAKLLKEFPFCVDHLKTLSQYIQDLSITNLTIKSEFSPIIADIQTFEDKDDPFNEILGYFKGKNEFGHEIMSDNAFTKLVESINKVIRNEAIKLESKFDIKEKNGVIKYTFYVLHLRLFGSDKNDLFYKFIHENILQFQNWEYDNFKSKISEPPSSLPNYIPPIIKEQKQRQMNQRK